MKSENPITVPEEQAVKRDHRVTLRLTALIIGLAGSAIEVVLIGIFSGPAGAAVAALILGGAMFLAWRKPLPGGTLLIVLGVFAIALVDIFLSIPLPVAGVLFIVYWRTGDKRVTKCFLGEP